MCPRLPGPLNTERSYITRLRCSACQSQIPTDGQCSHLIGFSLKSNFSELQQDSVFVPVFCGWEINLKTKIRKKYKQTAKVIYFIYGNMVNSLFFSQLSKRDSVRSTLAAVVVLQLKFSWPFTNFYGIQPWVFHFLSNVNIQAKSHFAIFQVLLLLHSSRCFQFLCTEYGTVWGITQCCSICILFAPS